MNTHEPFIQHRDQDAPHAGHPPIGSPDRSRQALDEFERKHGDDHRPDACLGFD